LVNLFVKIETIRVNHMMKNGITNTLQ